MKNKIPYILFFLLLIPVLARSQTTDKDTVSEQEKTVLLKVTKRFVKQMQQKRDVSKVSSTLVVNVDQLGFAAAMTYNDFSEDKNRYKPTPKETSRLSLAGMNFMYILGLDQSSMTDSLSKILTPKLKLSYDKIVDEMDGFGKVSTRGKFLRILFRLEGTIGAIRRHLVKKNIERSPEYKKNIAIREKDHCYEYAFSVIFSDLTEEEVNDNDKALVDILKSFGPGAKMFSVGTPYGYALLIVHQKKTYKIFGMFPHPFSGC